MRDDRERLIDVQETIADIWKYAERGRSEFEEEELIQTWIIHHLLILGEAVVAFSDSFREQHPDIPWFKIIGMRNVLVHNYFGIDLDIVWSVVEDDLPDLQCCIQKLL